ncbi:cell wall hydrolase [Paenibacillus sp. HB172176]|uniref:cell wall hydrolase n=1 Tax=Paenibacillus sp. HB172176 TaxID=2493690 RepID=UPI0014394153|nr:cell wall hydrolase [Paenibacillus sp. HB172176]
MLRTNLENRNSRIMLACLMAVMLLCVSPLTAFAATASKASVASDVSITLNGEQLNLGEPVLIKNERMFLPVAPVAKMFGAAVSWDKVNQEATIKTTFGDKIVLGIEVPTVYFNDGRYILEDAPFIENERTYVPLRQVAELLRASVKWNNEERIAELTTAAAAKAESAEAEAAVKENGGDAGIVLASVAAQDAGDQADAAASEEAAPADVETEAFKPSILEHPAAPFTDAEMQLLAKIVQVEAGYEPYEGQLAVANVILNRVKSKSFPNSIHDVIYSGKQFPPAHNGLLDKSVPNKSVLRAAKDALNGKNNVANAVYFYNPKVTGGSFWNSLDRIADIGHHRFAA